MVMNLNKQMNNKRDTNYDLFEYIISDGPVINMKQDDTYKITQNNIKHKQKTNKKIGKTLMVVGTSLIGLNIIYKIIKHNKNN